MADFLHPSVSSRIIDNSVVAITAQGLTSLFAAFPAAHGPDNRIQLVTSSSEFQFLYGPPNMRKYGQTAYNVMRWLDGGGQAFCIRVLPYMEQDAAGNRLQQSTYACAIVEVGVLDGAQTGEKKLKLRVRVLGDGLGHVPAATEENIRDDASLRGIVLAQPDDAEADGYKYHPLMVIRDLYRGANGNSKGVAITLTSGQDETYAHRLYQLDVFASPSRVAESFVFSLHPEAVDTSGQSQFIEHVLETYSTNVRCLFSEAGWEAVCDYIGGSPADYAKYDILSLQERKTVVAEAFLTGVALDDASADLAPSPEGFNALGGGTDGDWVGPNSLESLMYKAYSGSGDFIDEQTGANLYDTHFSEAHDKKAWPIDMTLDANYPQSVKVAMSNFSAKRGDCFSVLDVGFTGSPGQALTYRQNLLQLNTFYSAIFVQDFVVSDTYQGSDIRVTPTYFLADKIPMVDTAYGIHWPFVGPRRGSVVGFKAMSWNPNEAYQEQLYQARLNYVTKDTQMTAFMSQSTTQLVNSALSDISHVRTLLRIRRDVEKMAAGYLFEFNDKTTWNSLQYSVNQYLQGWVSNRALASAKGTVYASEYDKQQRICRIRIEIQFTGVIERILADIVVNR